MFEKASFLIVELGLDTKTYKDDLHNFLPFLFEIAVNHQALHDFKLYVTF